MSLTRRFFLGTGAAVTAAVTAAVELTTRARLFDRAPRPDGTVVASSSTYLTKAFVEENGPEMVYAAVEAAHAKVLSRVGEVLYPLRESENISGMWHNYSKTVRLIPKKGVPIPEEVTIHSSETVQQDLERK